MEDPPGELGYQSLGSVGFVGLWKRVRFVASEGVVGLVDEFGGTYGFGRARRCFGQKVLPQFPYTSWIMESCGEWPVSD
jgi:hypothetical protein